MALINKILAPVDFSACSAKSLAYAQEIAASTGAELHLIHVYFVPSYVPPHVMVMMGSEQLTLEEQAKVYAAEELEKFMKKHASEFARNLPLSIVGGDPSDAIVDFAKDGGFDMIVIGTHGRRSFSRWVMGSVAEKVVRSSACPVLTIRAEEDENE